MRSKIIGSNNDTAFAFMIGTVLIGVLLGTLSFCFVSGSAADRLVSAAKDYISYRQNSEIGYILLDSFFTSSLYIMALFISGLFALGQLPAIGILLFKGSGLGMALSQAYSSHSVSAAMILIPSSLISCYAISIAGKEAISSSTRLLTIIMSNDHFSDIAVHTKRYGAVFISLEAFAAVSAAVDCVFSMIFSGR